MKQACILLGILGLSYGGPLDNRYLPPPTPGSKPGSKPAHLTNAEAKHLPASHISDNRGKGSESTGRSPPSTQIPILHYESTNDGNGNYKYEYETGNGIQVNEEGNLKNVDSEEEAESVQGSFSYTAPDGQKYSLHYVADENGFQPSGDHLPTPPPIPEEIQKSLEQIHAQGGAFDDGQYREQGYELEQGYEYRRPQH